MAYRTIRKGARVRYVGHDENLAKAWGNHAYTVRHKYGDSVVGYFPVTYSSHLQEYSIRISDVELVTD